MFLARYFYFAMAMLLAAVVWYGFSHTIEENLFHPSFARPPLLYVHAAVFGGWMALFLVQTGLVALAGKRRWHRWLGWLGAVMACAVPVLGTWSAIRMTHLRYGFGDIDDEVFLILAFNDMPAFAALMAAAILLRNRQNEAHKRLVLMATCVITVAAPHPLPALAAGARARRLALLPLRRPPDRARPAARRGRDRPAALGLPARVSRRDRPAGRANTVYMTLPKPWMDFALQLTR